MNNIDKVALEILKSLLGNAEIQKGILKDNKKCKRDLERRGIKLTQDQREYEVMDTSSYVREWHINTAYQFAKDFMNYKPKNDDK
tara:strand:+ start:551 stop:805 length:255 start_codon:yes stop_codon:yes gene_type:complete